MEATIQRVVNVTMTEDEAQWLTSWLGTRLDLPNIGGDLYDALEAAFTVEENE